MKRHLPQKLHHDFPTRVGMARSEGITVFDWDGFPHPRGDGPTPGDRLGLGRVISPPAWGWPVGIAGYVVAYGDFPTRVGMARYRVWCTVAAIRSNAAACNEGIFTA